MPINDLISVSRDDWLCKMMERDVFKVVFPENKAGPETSLKSLRYELSDLFSMSPDAFYYVRIPSGEQFQLAYMQDLGFNVVDLNVTLGRDSKSQFSVRSDSFVITQWEDSDDNEDILDIALKSFKYSRFHLDPLIPNALANYIKREWIRNYLKGNRGECLLVATLEGQPVGFLAVLTDVNQGEELRIIDLIAVGGRYQNRGIGKALVARFIELYAGKGFNLKVGTQAANIASINLYQKLGFHVEETSYNLHAHYRNKRLLHSATAI